MADTSVKRGKGGTPVPKGKKFTTDNQPPPENKSLGWHKKTFTRELLKEMLQTKYKFAPDNQIKTQLRNAFGPEIEEMTVGQIMALQQMQKAVLKGDPSAFSNVMNQTFGNLLQAVAQVDSEGKDVRPLTLTLPPGMNIKLPDNIEGEGEEP